MLFVGILQHTPVQCPGNNKQLFDEVMAMMPRLPEIAKRHSVKILGLYSLMPSHRNVVVLDAPSAEAAETLLLDMGLGGWNTGELSLAHTAAGCSRFVRKWRGKT